MNFDDCEMKEKKRGRGGKRNKELDHLVTLATYLLVVLQVL
jgi:hypothetical protein